MPLKAPNLDDRDFAQIKQQILERIPRYTREWTDFNESDPGITLVELFAWLTETILYRVNQVPERNYLKFLKLLNMELEPPLPAEAHLSFFPRPGAGLQPVSLRSRVAAQSVETGELITFETEQGLDLIPFPLSDVQVYDGAAFQTRSEENLIAAGSYFPLGSRPVEGSAFYLGFTPPEVLPPPGTRYFPQQLRFRVFLPAITTAGEPQVCESGASGLPPAPPVELVWEYRHPDQVERWRPLTTYEDETAGLTREGYILIEGPEQVALSNEGRLIDPVAEARLWLRCRLKAGSYPLGKEPRIEFIRPNTVRALSVTTVRDEILGNSDGTPDQFFELRHRPILQGSALGEDVQQNELQLEVTATEVEAWNRVDDFLASGADDSHFVLEAATGIIRFGNGRHGRIPAGDARIVATHYRYGGGRAANVPAASITIPLSTLTGVDKVSNERKAVGGRDEQSVEDLKLRAPCVLRHRNRAVTAEDFAALAQRAGGVLRATALAQTHPGFPGVEVPGAITVVILPDNQDMPPKPSGELIRHVCGYLDDYRLLTTELYVKGPEFVQIRVEVKVSASPQVATGTVERLVRAALNARLDPLDWSFGRDFNPTGLYRDIYRVRDEFDHEIIRNVEHLAIFVDNQPHDLSQAVALLQDQLLYGGEHEIVVVPDQD